ncbi:FxsA family protein [Stappia sp.]|uniref:FxsA family protein n=1 Tax=Stappia sp. TaxID=1870903 RepID=UPI003A99C00C
MPLGLILLLALIGLPLIEIAVFVEVGSEIGAVPTILLTVLTALAGTVMLRMQGLSLLTRMRAEMDRGEVPGEDIVQGALIVVASFLLLVPGFVTDAVGIALFIPPLRSLIARAVVRNARVTVVRPGQPGGARRGDGVVDLDPDAWSDVNQNGRNGNGDTPWNTGDRLTDGRGPNDGAARPDETGR